MTMHIEDEELKDALKTVLFRSLLEIDDIDTVCCYDFDMRLCTGHNIKGSVNVEFEEVE